jgi:RNA polymerase sigma factor (sigma-70 family)
MVKVMTGSRTRDLIGRAQEGDKAAYGRLVALYERRIEALALSLMSPPLRRALPVEDVVQETFTRGFESLGRFQWRAEGSFMRWLGAIARNIIANAARRQRGLPVLELTLEISGSATSPSKLVRREERFERLKTAILDLRPEQRKVIQLFWLEGLLKKIHAGRFSLRVVAGQTESPFPFPERTLSPVTLRDFRRLSKARGLDPLEEAVAKLAAVAEAVRKPDGHYHLARAHRLLGRMDEAIKEVRRALACDPGFVPAEILAIELAGKRPFERGGDRIEELRSKYRTTGWKKLWLEATASTAKKRRSKAILAYDRLMLTRPLASRPTAGGSTSTRAARTTGTATSTTWTSSWPSVTR